LGERWHRQAQTEFLLLELLLNALGRGGTETDKERRLGEKPQTNQADQG
jgi:hypothetical protein